jgi:anti-sigma regulatory factor (Ser/Thr protein kinase)
LGVEREGVGESPMHELEMPFDASSVSLARARLSTWMDERGAGGQQPREDAALVLSELLSNALRHGRALDDGQLRAAWRWSQGHLEITVTDGGGPTSPRVLLASEDATDGRGMAIVDRLADTWWQTVEGSASTVHARLRL